MEYDYIIQSVNKFRREGAIQCFCKHRLRLFFVYFVCIEANTSAKFIQLTSAHIARHDDDGDGRYDRYTVEAAAGLAGSVTIPGEINGVPVSAITDLSGDTVNGLLGGGISSIIIQEGVTEIASSAFAGTAGLNYVEVPSSVESIGANAFSSGWGAVISKKVSIKYNGTWAQWKAICGNNWDSGLGDESKVECTDGTYVLNTSWGDSNHDWPDWQKK